MYLRCRYIANELDIDLYPDLLTPELAAKWYDYIDCLFNKDLRRTSILFGNENLIYSVTYQGITKQSYTVCVIQRYPNGKIGINPHRDKEMVLGTRICGLSLGAKRIIQFTRLNNDPVSISLLAGSLYCMNPPTNQKWLHSIIKEPHIKEIRYSLTFRDYRNYSL